MTWFWLALGSAVFAALTSILAKIGIEGVNSHLATAIRTMAVVVMAWGMVFLTNAQGGIKSISQRSWLFSDPFRRGDRRILALLLQGAAAGKSDAGGPDRQAQRRDHAGAGLRLPA